MLLLFFFNSYNYYRNSILKMMFYINTVYKYNIIINTTEMLELQSEGTAGYKMVASTPSPNPNRIDQSDMFTWGSIEGTPLLINSGGASSGKFFIFIFGIVYVSNNFLIYNYTIFCYIIEIYYFRTSN